MNTYDSKVLFTEIEKANYQSNPKEKQFLKNVGWLIKNDLKLSSAQGSWLQAIYRKSQGVLYGS